MKGKTGLFRILSGASWTYLYFACVSSAMLLVVSGLIQEWGRWYSPSPYYRIQSLRFLEGKLSLSDEIRDAGHDLTWSRGGVHQVWGLGIPLWRLPFDLVAQGTTGKPASDRLVFGAFAALCSAVLFRGLFNLTSSDGKKIGDGSTHSIIKSAGGAVILVGFPPLISLLRTRGLVYEEAVSYSYFYALLLATCILRLNRRPTWPRFHVLCLLSGLGGLIRPTLIFYGWATLLAGFLVMKQKAGPPNANLRKGGLFTLNWLWNKSLWLGLAFYLAGGALLWGTNYLRFGDGFEFGHRLNLQKGDLLVSVFSTRFDYPFRVEPLWSAAKELFGALFLADQFNFGGWYESGVFPGQSSTLRWREFYFTTFHWGHFVLAVAGWAAGAASWMVPWRRRTSFSENGRIAGQTGEVASGRKVLIAQKYLSLWSLGAFMCLAVFFLRTPALSSRYMMDFGPAFAVSAMLAFWRLCDCVCFDPRKADRAIKSYGPALLLAAFWGWDLYRVQSENQSAYSAPRSITASQASTALRPALEKRTLPPLAEYRSKKEAVDTFAHPYNGAGWNSPDGILEPCAIFFIWDPEFLELELDYAGKDARESPVPNHIRAKVGFEFLDLEKIEPIEKGWQIRFAGPRREIHQQGPQIAFISAVSTENLAPKPSAWALKKFRWRPKE